MRSDDWKRVKAIAIEAWGRPDAERIPYITDACAGTDGLEREVLSLVASMTAAEERFEVPACLPHDDVAEVGSLVGRRVGAYEILSRIGAGGMGEVYKARDTRLDRIVAIKVLPTFSRADPLFRERMTREARAVAALNHPHICVVHDVGTIDGLDFFVMEYVEGETLATRLSREKLPIGEALQYADQIASALGAAHRAGIVHRDVKPANIMLDRTGQRSAEGAAYAKLLDFGVATTNPLDTASGPTPRDSEINPNLTSAGLVLGTVHYAAPEQFDQTTTDTRTDIFAFGAVLFEMLTRCRAFEGMDRAQIIADVRQKEVARTSSLRPEIPAALDRIVVRCLAKSRADRYQTVDDLLVDLRAVRRRLDSSRLRMLAVGTTLLALIAGGAAAAVIWAGLDPGPAAAPSVTRLAASAGVLGAPALSPDGSQVAFPWAGDGADNPELVLLRIGSTTRVRLTNDPGVEEWPVWSPDGKRIAFIRCGIEHCGILTVPVGGGPERKIRDLRHDRYYGLAWSPDGRSIAYAERPSSTEPYALYALSLDRLVTRRLTNPRRGQGGELRFAFSPDGSTLAVIRLGESIGVHLVSIKTGTETALLTGQHEWFGGIAWRADGRYLIISANQQGVRRLWRLPTAGGGLEQVAAAGEDAYFPSVSRSGERLAFVREFMDWDLSRMVLSFGPRAPSAAFPSSARIDLDPAFSRDGRKLAFVSERGGTREVWVSNADGTEPLRLTSLQGPPVGKPSWSPDGRYLAFHASGIHVMPAGGGPLRRVSDGEFPTWSADGRLIYFIRGFHVWRVPAEGGSAVQAITSEATAAHEGPDGANLYFAKINGGIWRRPVTGGEETPVIQEFTWSLPGYWSVFSDGIYYVVRETLADHTFAHHFKFFDFASRRTTELGTLMGNIDHWVGGLTISSDRRTLVYSQRTYQSSEVVLVEPFR